jgi:hypothetical protein
MQALIDDLRNRFAVPAAAIRACLHDLDVHHLLPNEQAWPSWEPPEQHSLSMIMETTAI